MRFKFSKKEASPFREALTQTSTINSIGRSHPWGALLAAHLDSYIYLSLKWFPCSPLTQQRPRVTKMSHETGSSLPYPTDDKPTESLDVQSWSELCALEITPNKCLSKLRLLLSCPSKVAAARSLQGSDAKTLINFLDRVSGLRASCVGQLMH